MPLIIGLVAAALATVLVLLAALARDGSPTARPQPEPSVSPPRSAVPVLPAASGAPLPEPATLARVLARGVADPSFGGRLAGVVVGAHGPALFARAAGALLPPASTAKLATAVAALSSLPPNARLTTRVVQRGTTVVLVGGGDPTLASPAAARLNPRLASLDRLAATTAGKLRAAGIGTVSLVYDASEYVGPRTGPGWKPDYVSGGDVAPVTALMVDGGRVRPDRRARQPDPATAAAAMFGSRLAVHGVRVRGVPHSVPGSAGSGPELATVTSLPTGELVDRMLTSSDNDLAEALGRAVAAQAGLPRSFAGAAEGIRRAVTALGVNVARLRLLDASGLSPLDRATPGVLAAILVAAESRPVLRRIFPGLPVAGFTGTLHDRFRTGPAAAAAGLVRAKTGTLRDVSALAGIVVDRTGAVLAFAFLAPAPSSRSRAEAALDRLAATLATL